MPGVKEQKTELHLSQELLDIPMLLKMRAE
jgi:hypothetical protein